MFLRLRELSNTESISKKKPEDHLIFVRSKGKPYVCSNRLISRANERVDEPASDLLNGHKP